jgi:hypothetical protein
VLNRSATYALVQVSCTGAVLVATAAVVVPAVREAFIAVTRSGVVVAELDSVDVAAAVVRSVASGCVVVDAFLTIAGVEVSSVIDSAVEVVAAADVVVAGEESVRPVEVAERSLVVAL